jgi:cell division protein FtsN
MTTDPHDEHGEILRRALHAEADTVNPAGDGLERIRARIADGQSRRFGLGRYLGPARFGLDRFTVGWARPVLAVAAAVLIAALGVTAPQTMSLIQQTVGNNGPSDGGQNNTGEDRTDAQGNPQFPDPSSPGASASGSPSAASTVSPSSSPGLSSCRIPQPGAASASPGTTATPTPATTPCTSETPSQSPTTPAPSAPTTPPSSEKPTDAPTLTPTSEPVNTAEQGAASTP